MIHRFLLSVFVLLLVTACGPRYGDFFPCYDDGTPKPRVVLLPMKDCSGDEERVHYLMDNIRFKLMNRGALYVYSEETVSRQFDKMGNVSLFSPDISFAKTFGGADFVVATELIECYHEVENKYISPSFQKRSLLTLKLRLRMIDLRCQEPAVVLQEIITKNLMVPVNPCCEEISPIYFKQVSDRLAEEVTTRVESTAWSLH